mgnify:CR=1 FL=1
MVNRSERAHRAAPAGSSGFTLLEMMVTVALIAVTATFVSLNISQSDSRIVELEARRFVALLNMAQDESIITGRPILLSVDGETRSYHFAALEDAALFMDEAVKDGEEEGGTEENEAYDPKADSFYRPRNFPETLAVQFTRHPDSREKEANATMVPQRVHEILNQSMFDEDEDPVENTRDEHVVVIEPNGLTSPFTLSLAVEGHQLSVELDRFGRAALVEPQ